MIEFTVQPTQPVLPCQFDPTQICDPEALGFAAQLSLLASKPTVMDVLPDGKVPLPTGKTLPVGPDVPCPVAPPPETEPEEVALQPVPIMRPLNSKLNVALLTLSEEATVEAPATEQPEPRPASAEQAEVRAEALLLPTTLAVIPPVVAPFQPLPVAAAKSQSDPQRPPPAVQSAALPTPSATPANPPADESGIQPQTTKLVDLRTHALPIAAFMRPRASAEIAPAPSLPTPNPITVQTVVQTQAVAAQGLLPSRPADPRRKTEPVIELVRALPKAEGIRLAPVELPNFRTSSKVQPAIVADPIALHSPALTVTHAAPSATPITHDFAALIDRIVAAREASGAPVALAVRHAEFGPVTLRFEQGDNGLSVAATSPDPDFARAAAAALPAERPATTDTSPRDGGKAPAQHETVTTNGSGSGQARQQPGTAHTLPASRSHTNPASTEDDRDSGIFA